MIMRNKTAFKVALGGICSALCLTLMFCSSFLPMLDYTIPAFAGFIPVIVAVEVNPKWAMATYAAVSFLTVFITPNYEASILFIIFMGYYPLLKIYLDRLKSKALNLVIKFLIFNSAAVIFFVIFQYIVAGQGDMLEGLEKFGRFAPFILLALGNITFIIYDYMLKQLTDIYTGWFRTKILRRK